MFLFIFENIGTSELILVGIIALIFLGPRKLPEIARKMGKIMTDFRATTNEFKSTWEREVNFEEEERALRTGELQAADPVRERSILGGSTVPIPVPEIRSVDRDAFETLAPIATEESRDVPHTETGSTDSSDENVQADARSDKRTWL